MWEIRIYVVENKLTDGGYVASQRKHLAPCRHDVIRCDVVVHFQGYDSFKILFQWSKFRKWLNIGPHASTSTGSPGPGG